MYWDKHLVASYSWSGCLVTCNFSAWPWPTHNNCLQYIVKDCKGKNGHEWPWMTCLDFPTFASKRCSGSSREQPSLIRLTTTSMEAWPVMRGICFLANDCLYYALFFACVERFWIPSCIWYVYIYIYMHILCLDGYDNIYIYIIYYI